jgi:hypothetical protein
MTDKWKFTNRFYHPSATQDSIIQIPMISSFCHSEWREFFYKWSTKAYLGGNPNIRRPTYIQNSDLGQSFENLKFQKEELKKILEEQKKLIGKFENQVVARQIPVKSPKSAPKEDEDSDSFYIQ